MSSDAVYYHTDSSAQQGEPSLNYIPLESNSDGMAAAGARILGNDQVLELAKQVLLAGKVLAVKGLGGYHLVCNARDEACLARLRLAKKRPHKPFAVMFRNMEALRQEVVCPSEAELLLTSPARPIVILPRSPTGRLPGNVSPDLGSLGTMLPYTTWYEPLFLDELDVLVVTSANGRGAPIVYDDASAPEQLRSVASAVISHDRPIHQPVDDSVWRYAVDLSGTCSSLEPVLLRRSRGYVPLPISLQQALSVGVLGVGSDLKAAFCLARGTQAFLSAYLGDLARADVVERYYQTLHRYIQLLGIQPGMVVCDPHPGWVSSQVIAGGEWSHLPRITVQHHHAHIAACMGENGVSTPTLGVAYDGTGYGGDGTVWGGEFLLCTPESSIRLASWRPVSLPGGDKAIAQPWRMALSYLQEADMDQPAAYLAPCGLLLPPHTEREMRQLVASWGEYAAVWPVTSSVGRLFDGIAAMLGLCSEITYEGQAAMLLEGQAWTALRNGMGPLTPFDCAPALGDPATSRIPTALLIREIADSQKRGTSREVIAARFHRTVALVTAEVSERLCREHQLDTVALSGGVWQNRLLWYWTVQHLEYAGLRVIGHKMLPPNDGCIGYGQVVVAGARMLR